MFYRLEVGLRCFQVGKVKSHDDWRVAIHLEMPLSFPDTFLSLSAAFVKQDNIFVGHGG
jgi:hypothetical protein